MKIMEKNINKVPKKQWLEWSEVARKSFNYTYKFFYHNQKIIIHTKMKPSPDSEWKTIAWNAAWVAADSADNAIATIAKKLWRFDN